MKTLILFLGLILLFSCEKEDLSNKYYHAIQGKWINPIDSSTLFFYDVVLYMNTDTVKASCSYRVENNIIRICKPPYIYYLRIDYVDKKILIVNNILLKITM